MLSHASGRMALQLYKASNDENSEKELTKRLPAFIGNKEALMSHGS